MVGGGFASVLGSVWTLGLALYVTAWVRPFEALDLLALDALSLASTAIMFGLCGIASMLREGEEGRRSATATVGALTGVVHLSMCVVFLLAFAFHLWRAVTDFSITTCSPGSKDLRTPAGSSGSTPPAKRSPS